MSNYYLSSPAAAAATSASTSPQHLFTPRRFLHHRLQVFYPSPVAHYPILSSITFFFFCSYLFLLFLILLLQNHLLFACAPLEISSRCSLVPVRAMAGTKTASQTTVSSVLVGNN
jgi:hypothetical protein